MRASRRGSRSTNPGACPTCLTAPAERHYVQALYHLTKTLDPTRPVIGNDGWEAVATDIIGIHDYDNDPTRIARRYHTSDARLRLFQHERPGGRLLRIGDSAGRRTIRSCSRSLAASRCSKRTPGGTRSQSLRRSWLIVIHSCFGSFPDYRCWRASATLSLRTHTRSGTASCMRIAGRSFRSPTSRKPRSVNVRPGHGRPRQPARRPGPPDVQQCPDFTACVAVHASSTST